MVLTLDPYLTMRKDGDRVIVYPNIYAQFGRSFDFAWRIIHPRAAIIISLFDGVRDQEEVAGIWSNLNGFDNETGMTHVQKTLEDYSDILFESENKPEGFQPVNPEDIVVDMNKFDLRTDRLHLPNSMLYLPTMLCSHRCRYCYADYQSARDPNELTPKELEIILDQCVEMKFAEVTVSGGDPFLRKDAYEIIGLLFSRGFKFDVPTKSPLSKKNIRRLKDLGVDRLQISLDSPFDAGAVETLTGKKDYFKSVMRTLKTLGEADFKVGITSVITSLTIDDVPRMVEYYGGLGFINRVSFAQVGASIYREFPELYPPEEKYLLIKKEVQDLKPKYPHMALKCDYLRDAYYMSDEERGDFFEKRPVCSGGRWAFVLLPDGRVTLCEELYYIPEFIVGDLRKQTIEEMWHSPEMLRVMEPEREDFAGSPCYDCDEFLKCHTTKGRCWKRAYKAFKDRGNAAYWPDPYCTRAPKLERRLS